MGGGGGEGDLVDGSLPLNGTTSQVHKRQLVGYDGFKRQNPKSDRFNVIGFDHVEFWCGDATNTSQRYISDYILHYNFLIGYRSLNTSLQSEHRFGFGLGMTLIARSDQGTGNQHFASYVMNSQDITFVFTAPYSTTTNKKDSTSPMPWYSQDAAHEFIKKHGLAVRALGLRVQDTRIAFQESVTHGAIVVQSPTVVSENESQYGVEGQAMSLVVAEVMLYGDVVLRFVSGNFAGPFIPGYKTLQSTVAYSIDKNQEHHHHAHSNYGLRRLDHAVGNVPELLPVVGYIAGFTGFHEFAEFVAEDVGTIDSGLNSMVLASNNEMVLLPVNEPTFGTKRKSQIQTFLEQNEGPGLQHLALLTDDIFTTLIEMQSKSYCGGFEFMPKPSQRYYNALPEKIGDALTREQYDLCEQLGILVDKDDQGVLLQIFTKPLGDRPTVFIEIIQRLCAVKPEGEDDEVGACGGFGKGNFSELFQSIETYETNLGIN